MLNDDILMNEARRIVSTAKEKGVTLRLLGAIAFRLHCPQFLYLSERMHRVLTDIDMMGCQRQRDGIIALMKGLSYTYDTALHLEASLLGGRLIFWKKDLPELHVDIFLDRLDMCHSIDFKDRLEVEDITIPLAEMLLEKMQIVKSAEKDFKDSIMLLREHVIGDSDVETVNIIRIADILSRDWGFYYTMTENLKKLRTLLPHYDTLTLEDRQDVEQKISVILETVEKWPKTMGWKLRARVGARRKWYQDVEETKR